VNRSGTHQYGAWFVKGLGMEHRTIAVGIKKALILEYGMTCRNCQNTVDEIFLDHIKPIAMGGDDRISNFQLLCKPCHNAKTTRERLEINRIKREIRGQQ
jgi:5-methylcytosine-specific restriction endonuclease McrA